MKSTGENEIEIMMWLGMLTINRVFCSLQEWNDYQCHCGEATNGAGSSESQTVTPLMVVAVTNRSAGVTIAVTHKGVIWVCEGHLHKHT